MDKWYLADSIVNIVMDGMENGDATTQLIYDKLVEYDESFFIEPLIQAAFKQNACLCSPARPAEDPPDYDDEEHEEDLPPEPVGAKKCGLCFLREAAEAWVDKKEAAKKEEAAALARLEARLAALQLQR